MKISTKYHIGFFSILFAFSFSIDISFKKNITSLIITIDIEYFNNSHFIATNGGLYSIENMELSIHDYGLKTFDLTGIYADEEFLWISSNHKGMIQVLDSNLNISKIVDYPLYDFLGETVFSDEYAYSIAHEENSVFVVQYLKNNGEPIYLNTLSNFNLEYNSINDIQIYNGLLYIATDNGLLSAYINENEENLIFSNEWNVSNAFMDIKSLALPYFFADNSVYDISIDEMILTFDLTNDSFVDLKTESNIYVLTSNRVRIFDKDYPYSEMNNVTKPEIYKQDFSCFDM